MPTDSQNVSMDILKGSTEAKSRKSTARPKRELNDPKTEFADTNNGDSLRSAACRPVEPPSAVRDVDHALPRKTGRKSGLQIPLYPVQQQGLLRP
jgi:hypothetical protein